MRRLLCRWFNLVRTEDVPAPVPAPEPVPVPMWGDLWDYRFLTTVWPRITMSDVWKQDLEPWFKHSLLRTFVALGQERDPERMRRLQERAVLINEWLEAPKLADIQDRAIRESQYMAGTDLDTLMGATDGRR